MNTGNWMRLASHSRTIRMAGMAAALLVALLVTACGAGNPAIGGQTPRPTATVPAESQDVVSPPSTVPTPVATTTLPPLTATKVHKPLPTGIPAAPSAAGKVILVSLSRQQLYAYDNGEFAFTILVETGRPELATPTGLYHVFYKSCSDQRWLSNTAPTSAHNANCTEHNGDGFQETFRSPWPEGSPYWYAPTHINYALKFRDDGFYLHDAWWHVAFGPGSNVPHQLPNGTWETGSHGCVGMPTSAAEKLYAWTPIGTPVYIRWGV